MHANAMRVLHRLGLGEAVERDGAVLRRWSFADARGGALFETDLDTMWDDTDLTVGIARPRLHEVLIDAARDVPCRLGVDVSEIDRDAFDLVVGADGVHSTVRDSRPVYSGAMVWRAIADWRPSDLEGLAIFVGDGCLFGILAIGACATTAFGVVESAAFVDPLDGRCGGCASASPASADTRVASSPRSRTTSRCVIGARPWLAHSRCDLHARSWPVAPPATRRRRGRFCRRASPRTASSACTPVSQGHPPSLQSRARPRAERILPDVDAASATGALRPDLVDRPPRPSVRPGVAELDYLPYRGHTKAREAGSARFSVSSRTRGERAGANSGGAGQGMSRVGGDPALAGRRVDEPF
jgi:hypothetical protein